MVHLKYTPIFLSSAFQLRIGMEKQTSDPVSFFSHLVLVAFNLYHAPKDF